MYKLAPILLFALLAFEGCNLQDTPKPTSNDAQATTSQSLGRVAADSATLHQVADDKTAGQNRPATGTFRDPETGDKYQLNAGWRVMPRDPKSATPALAKTSGLIQTWTDWTGQVETRIYECVTPSAAQHQSLACQVESGFVAVGGGAYADYGSGAGALLWESRIADAGDGSSPFITWLASSKDHSYACPHILHVYVVGMRLKDNYGNYMDPSLLRNRLTLRKYTTSPLSHLPYLNTTVPYVSIGMGARTNWSSAGCLLFASESFSSSGSYSHIYGGGKDHIVSDPSTVTLYSIDLEFDNNRGVALPNFGNLYFSSEQCDGSAVNTGVASTFCDVYPGFTLVGMGGESRWTSGAGRLLFGIKPTGTYSGQIAIYSKDHRSVSGGYNHASLTEAVKW